MAKKRKGAVALQYSPEKETAPKVTAKGWGTVAEKILEIAGKNGIPVRKDSDLLELLSVLDLDETIPPELYQVVAEILAFVYKINADMGS